MAEGKNDVGGLICLTLFYPTLFQIGCLLTFD